MAILKGLALPVIVSGLILTMLPGCETNTVATDAFCQIYSPITTSSSDTEETERQVVEMNAVYDELCL